MNRASASANAGYSGVGFLNRISGLFGLSPTAGQSKDVMEQAQPGLKFKETTTAGTDGASLNPSLFDGGRSQMVQDEVLKYTASRAVGRDMAEEKSTVELWSVLKEIVAELKRLNDPPMGR
jgi:hypothetical protein